MLSSSECVSNYCIFPLIEDIKQKRKQKDKVLTSQSQSITYKLFDVFTRKCGPNVTSF